MHVEKGLSLGYFQDIFLNVIFSCTLCADKQGISLILDMKQWEDLLGGSSVMNSPLRQVPISLEKWYEIPFDKHKPTAAVTCMQESALQMNVNKAVFKSSSNIL